MGKWFLRFWADPQRTLVGTLQIPAPTGDVFTWSPVSALTIAPGTSTQVLVDFAPPGAGQAHATLQVQSNAAGSPHHVSLEGTGKSIITP